MDNRILEQVLKYGQDMWNGFSRLRVQSSVRLL